MSLFLYLCLLCLWTSGKKLSLSFADLRFAFSLKLRDSDSGLLQWEMKKLLINTALLTFEAPFPQSLLQTFTQPSLSQLQSY